MKVVCILAMVHSGTTLLDLVRRVPESPHDQYEMVLSAFGRQFGEDRVLVDSSKTVETVQTWAELIGKENVCVLLLVRDVRGWVTSMIDLSKRTGEHRIADLLVKFGLGAPKEIARRTRLNRFRQWYRGNQRLQGFLEQSTIGSFQLGYEELCLSPDLVLAQLCRFLGVSPDPGMLSIAQSGQSRGAR